MGHMMETSSGILLSCQNSQSAVRVVTMTWSEAKNDMLLAMSEPMVCGLDPHQ